MSDIEYVEGGDGKIDKEFIPLLEELNKVGLKTTQCCAGHTEDALAYLSISLENIDDVAIRESGKRLVIFWKRNKKDNQTSKLLHVEKYITPVVHSEAMAKITGL